MVRQAGYIGIVVDNLAAATAFYRDTLGLPVDDTASNPALFIQFNLAGGAMLALQAGTEAPDGQPFEPALVVDDVDATYATWQSRGVELLDAPHDMPYGRTFLFRTPQGHVLRAYQP